MFWLGENDLFRALFVFFFLKKLTFFEGTLDRTSWPCVWVWVVA